MPLTLHCIPLQLPPSGRTGPGRPVRPGVSDGAPRGHDVPRPLRCYRHHAQCRQRVGERRASRAEAHTTPAPLALMRPWFFIELAATLTVAATVAAVAAAATPVAVAAIWVPRLSRWVATTPLASIAPLVVPSPLSPSHSPSPSLPPLAFLLTLPHLRDEGFVLKDAPPPVRLPKWLSCAERCVTSLLPKRAPRKRGSASGVAALKDGK